MSRAAARLAPTLALLLALLVGTPQPASAEVQWQDPERLSPGGFDTLTPSTAIGSDGTAAAIWVRTNGLTSSIEAAVRPRTAGAWGETTAIPGAAGAVAAARIVVDGAGNATAVWRQEITTPTATRALMASTRASGGSWTTPVTVATGLSANVAPAIGVDAAGTVTALWGAFPSTFTATLPRGGSWSAPVAFTGASGNGALTAALAVAPSGAALAVWTTLASTPSAEYFVLAAARSALGVWSAPTVLSSGPGLITDAVAGIADDGSGIAAWAQQLEVVITPPSTTGLRLHVRTATVSATGSPGTVQTVSSDPTDQNQDPSLAMTPAGDAILAYAHTELASGPDRVMSVERPAAGSWTTPTAESDLTKDANSPSAAADRDGRVGILWRDDTTTQQRAVATFRESASSTWSPRTLFSAPNDAAASPSLALGAGRGLMVWTGGSAPTVLRAIYGAASPALDATPNISWLDSTDISAEDVPVNAPASPDKGAQVVMDRDGNTTALWASDESGASRIWTAHRPAGQAWRAPEALAGPGFVDDPRLVAAPSGEVTAVWYFEADGSDRGRLFAASLSPGGTWSAPVGLSADTADHYVGFPVVSVASDGAVTAAWRLDDAVNDNVIQSATRSPGGSWSAPETLSAIGPQAQPPRIATAPDGATLVVWQDGGSTPTQLVARRRASASAAWEAQVVVEDFPDSAPGSWAVVAGGDSRFVVTWQAWDGANTRVFSSIAPAGTGTFGTSRTHSSPGVNASDMLVRAADDGAALLTWRESDGLRQRVTWTRLPAAGSWSDRQRISPASVDAHEPVIAGDGAGRVSLAWTETTFGVRQVRAARIDGGELSLSELLSPSSSNAEQPRLHLDSEGNGVVLWAQERAFGRGVRASGIDAAAPRLTGLGSTTIPATAVAGSPVALAASPVDVWSTIGSIAWDFGDGRTATGTNVSHAYATAGAFTVTVTATDGFGRARSSAATVTVSEAPVVQGDQGGVTPKSTPAPPATTPQSIPRITLSQTGSRITLDVDVRRRSASGACPSPKTLPLRISERRKVNGRTRAKALTERRTSRALKVTRTASACRYQGALRLTRSFTLRAGRTLTVTIEHPKLRTRTVSRTAP